jgi:IS605 OrfB family transposase
MILTFKYRVKDASARRHLRRHARACNYVWNYCCEVQRHAMKWQRKWPSAFDLIKLCTGSAAELRLHSDTAQTICREFVARRNYLRRCPGWRSAKKSLGWVPFIQRAVQIDDANITYLKRRYQMWLSRGIGGEIRAGCFVQDARGRWYVAMQCEVVGELSVGTGDIGIDLGLKTLATCSDGTIVPALQHYRRYEAALARAQRANNKGRVRTIHAKIANSRRHHLHQQSTRITRDNRLIVVGNVNAASLKKTRMAKSVLDAGWSMFRTQLRYKASRHGARYVEADERWTSQLCSDCGAVGGPKGIAQLGMRHWVCCDCGSCHDRDVNAARNILAAGLERQAPAEEISGL